jgi:hypothetical protein
MKIIITEDKLDKIYEGFKRVMEEYSNLHKIERPYDFWVQSRNTYVDYTPFNFYKEIDDDDFWEDDDWVFQYSEVEPYTGNKIGVYPMLQYSSFKLKSFKKIFGTWFETLLKRWFEETYELPVNKVVDDREGYEILDLYGNND